MIHDEQFSGIRKGLLEFALLSLIGANRVYAADILTRLGRTPFATQEGTLYPLLSRMRRDEVVQYEWVESDAGPPRKYYSLTEKGRARLEDLGVYWRLLTTTLEQLGR
ncbi:MAG: PadR family transcriptional regulator [Alphaproteobacteria bacterium]|nr:PadR family transcriptional regulator [Alphaproteobacteria bacterium]